MALPTFHASAHKSFIASSPDAAELLKDSLADAPVVTLMASKEAPWKALAFNPAQHSQSWLGDLIWS